MACSETFPNKQHTKRTRQCRFQKTDMKWSNDSRLKMSVCQVCRLMGCATWRPIRIKEQKQALPHLSEILLIEHHMTCNGFSIEQGMHLHEFPEEATCLAALKTALIFAALGVSTFTYILPYVSNTGGSRVCQTWIHECGWIVLPPQAVHTKVCVHSAFPSNAMSSISCVAPASESWAHWEA